MTVKTKPVHLNLLKMKFPPMAIASGLHRVSGILLFLLLPLALYLLHGSLHSANDFAHMQAVVAMPIIRFLIWVLLSAASYHLFAGIRHMLMDCGVGEHLKSARCGAYLVILLAIVAMILLGVWLWA